MIKFKDVKWSEHYDSEGVTNEEYLRVRIPGVIQAAIFMGIAIADLADAIRGQANEK
jgi:hypothetical protein